MEVYNKLLEENKSWSKKMMEKEPEFFSKLLNVQNPQFLWIGCSDSRVPPDVITQTKPGEIFIHRNIANMVVHTDLNMLSVLQYAVEVLKVHHIIVCGHYGCGGVKAAMTNHSLGLINKWLRNIKDVYRYHQTEIELLKEEETKLNRLIELNVVEQVMNLAKTSIIQKSWIHENGPYLHGWVYDLHDGILRPQIDMPPGSRLDHPIFEYDNL
ncbi:MAG: carbonate dehydratase [Bacteroidetes bacterium]|nr:carbonate dehydratase [Bacteroidota bacterium]